MDHDWGPCVDWTKIVPIVASFIGLITVVIGSMVAFALQQRQWKLRRGLEIKEKRVEIARSTFEEISGLMDRRLFCTAQLILWTKRGEEDLRENALIVYREAIRDWNYSINRILALLQIYFGDRVRNNLDSDVGRQIVEVGAQAERLYRFKDRMSPEEVSQIDLSYEKLYSGVFDFNIDMLNEIRKQEAEAGVHLHTHLDMGHRDIRPDVQTLITVIPPHQEPSKDAS
jgi:hypothetical protein